MMILRQWEGDEPGGEGCGPKAAAMLGGGLLGLLLAWWIAKRAR